MRVSTWVGLLISLFWLWSCCGEPKTADGFLSRGEKEYQGEKYDKAIVSFRRGLALDQGSARGYHLLGMAYRMKYNTSREGEWKEKELQAFENAVVADSTYWPAHVNLGAALFYLGRKREAAGYLSTALELNPQNPEREKLEEMIREGRRNGDDQFADPETD